MKPRPTDAELGEILQRILKSAGPISRFERTPSLYASSYPLEELTISLSDGRVLKLMMKDVSPDSLSEDAQLAKPVFLRDPWREIEAYLHVVPLINDGPPKFYGSEVDEPAGRFLIFIEKLPGVELFQVGDLNVWKAVARWLARFHLTTVPAVSSAPSQLIRYDAYWYRIWAQRALQTAQNLSPPAREIMENYDQFAQRLLGLPQSCIHGEFYASNVLVDSQTNAIRVGPVDWEMAAVGPGLIDLAALVAGNWTDAKRTAIALAYFEEWKSAEWGDSANFLWLLDHARLHLDIQCLGWSNRWQPPRDHRHDWMNEMISLAERIGRNP